MILCQVIECGPRVAMEELVVEGLAKVARVSKVYHLWIEIFEQTGLKYKPVGNQIHYHSYPTQRDAHLILLFKMHWW